MVAMCKCSVRLLDPQDVTYMFRGIPICSAACYHRACEQEEKKNRERLEAAQRASA